jgi:hypothetical protein
MARPRRPPTTTTHPPSRHRAGANLTNTSSSTSSTTPPASNSANSPPTPPKPASSPSPKNGPPLLHRAVQVSTTLASAHHNVPARRFSNAPAVLHNVCFHPVSPHVTSVFPSNIFRLGENLSAELPSGFRLSSCIEDLPEHAIVTLRIDWPDDGAKPKRTLGIDVRCGIGQ